MQNFKKALLIRELNSGRDLFILYSNLDIEKMGEIVENANEKCMECEKILDQCIEEEILLETNNYYLLDIESLPKTYL